MAEPWWRTGPQDVHRLEDRISSLYAERCHIDRDDNAIVLVNKVRTVHVPAARLAVLLIGPGSRVTHPAVTCSPTSGTAVCWVGEQGVRLYATGTHTARGSQLQLRQAWLVTRPKERVAVARRMYDMRFPGENTTGLTLQQLRGREGTRIRSSTPTTPNAPERLGPNATTNRVTPSPPATTSTGSCPPPTRLSTAFATPRSPAWAPAPPSASSTLATPSPSSWTSPTSTRPSSPSPSPSTSSHRASPRNATRVPPCGTPPYEETRPASSPTSSSSSCPTAATCRTRTSAPSGTTATASSAAAETGAPRTTSTSSLTLRRPASAGTTVVVLIAAPPGPRGHLTRWFVEAALPRSRRQPPPTSRDRLWTVLAERDPRRPSRHDRTGGHGKQVGQPTAGRDRWTPVDFDGLTLMARPRQNGQQSWRPANEAKENDMIT
ncbi:CRISPR-associated endonuclease Cas1 [Streptomyces tendae]